MQTCQVLPDVPAECNASDLVLCTSFKECKSPELWTPPPGQFPFETRDEYMNACLFWKQEELERVLEPYRRRGRPSLYFLDEPAEPDTEPPPPYLIDYSVDPPVEVRRPDLENKWRPFDPPGSSTAALSGKRPRSPATSGRATKAQCTASEPQSLEEPFASPCADEPPTPPSQPSAALPSLGVAARGVLKRISSQGPVPRSCKRVRFAPDVLEKEMMREGTSEAMDEHADEIAAMYALWSMGQGF